MNKFLKSVRIYTISNILNASMPFLLLPILTRYFTPEEYGIVSMFNISISLIGPILGLSTNISIQKKFYDRENIDLSIYIYNCLIILFITSLVFIFSSYFFANQIERVFSFSYKYLYIAILICICGFIFNIALFLLQLNNKVVLYSIFSNLCTLINFIISIVFVVFFRYGWRGRIYGYLLSYIAFAIISLLYLIKNKMIKCKFDKNYIKNALKFSIPLVPHNLSGVILAFSDRFFIKFMVGLSEAGLYTVGYQFGYIINILATSFNTAYLPWLFERLKKNDERINKKIIKFSYIYFFIILCVSVFLGHISPYILNIFLGKNFHDSSIYIIWVAIGYAFNGMYLMVSNYIFYAEKTSYLSFITAITGVLNLILNYIFIKQFGAIGASQATVFIYILRFFMVWFLAIKSYKMPWSDVFIKK